VLDAHDVTFGIATPDLIGGGLCVLPNPVIAARLASAHNDWLLEHYLEPEPRLRGLIAISPQNPAEAAKEIRRVGGRDEFAGIFLPGGARIPYGNPVHDPIWEAADELALPVVVHTHYEGVGIAGPVTAAGYPDFYVEYHTLCGSGMYGHFVSILCHGIFERFPNTKVMMVEGGLVPFVGLLWRLDTNWKACRSEIPWCRKLPSEYVWDHVRFSSQPLETPADPALLAPAIQGLRPWDTLCFASDYPHWDYDEPAQTLRTLPAEWRENVAWRNAAEFYRLPVPAVV
jgi:predicted TIM-barrel fold metal-dependent hydrolase